MININYSIIIPHYNIPNLLIRCLQSIPERDDIQIIVVDDCSPDGMNYKKQYPILSRPNIEFYHLDKNGGGGKARNEGLKHAKGKWLIFADSDDYFTYCINEILNDYTDSDSDIIFFNANSIDSETFLNSVRCGAVNERINNYFNSEKADEYALRYDYGEPWCKIISSSLVRGHEIRYDETPIHNDTKFAYHIGYYASKISVDKRAGYCLTDRADSVSKNLTHENILVRMRVFLEKYRFLTEHGISCSVMDDLVYKVLIKYFTQNDINHFNECINISEEYGIDKYQLIETFKKERSIRRWHNRKVLIRQYLLKWINTIFR